MQCRIERRLAPPYYCLPSPPPLAPSPPLPHHHHHPNARHCDSGQRGLISVGLGADMNIRMELHCRSSGGVQLKAGYVNISPKDGTAATQLPTARGAQHSTALNFSPMLLQSCVRRQGQYSLWRLSATLHSTHGAISQAPRLWASGLRLSNKHNQPFSLPHNSGQP